jgi:hypothetical protein
LADGDRLAYHLHTWYGKADVEAANDVTKVWAFVPLRSLASGLKKNQLKQIAAVHKIYLPSQGPQM